MGKRNIVTKKREPEGQKKKEQEEAAAHAFEEFVATFQDAPGKSDKVWVKAGTYDAGRRHEDTREKGKLYKPQSRLSELADKLSTAERAEEYARMMGEKKSDSGYKKRGRDEKKKKSNLEMFKDELKMIQEEREDRHKYKGAAVSRFSGEDGHMTEPPPTRYGLSLEDTKTGSHDMGDPNTTNLYLGNLNPKITQQQLMEVFGKFGPLASIKIMWPRSDEERARGRHTGFVAFMTRRDGERAMKALKGKEIYQHEMKLGWGKTIPIPPRPIYIPPAMLELTRPPPPSGLPFNAQTEHKYDPRDIHAIDLDRILPQCVVKVVVPNERMLLMTIHRMIEFVIREGPMFEAMIMNREMNNPLYRFLFENQSPAHVYYRWKLFSLLQGDGVHSYRATEFRMFTGGSVWKPPPMHLMSQGMPDELIQDEEEEEEPTKGRSLSATQRCRLEDLIRNITQERIKIAETMVFCIQHAEAAEEICECIADSMSSLKTAMQKKIARLYLISDILHNCSVKVTNVSYYRRGFEARLVQMFKHVHDAYVKLDSRLKAEGFKLRVMKIFRAWEDWAVYPRDFIIRLQSVFLGLNKDSDGLSAVDEGGVSGGEDGDLGPLDGAALLASGTTEGDDDDIDGVPLDDDIDGIPMQDETDSLYSQAELKQVLPSGFLTSKWETVDPDQVEAQAMTTSKWEVQEEGEPGEDDEEESAGEDQEDEELPEVTIRDTTMNEERRARLREIELKVMQYQDELEAGSRALKSCWTIAQQVEHYRRKLLRKANREEQSAVVKQSTPTPPKLKGRIATPSPPRSKHTRAVSPSPPRSKHSRAKSPSSQRSRHSRAVSSPSPSSPPRSKHSRVASPPSPSSSSRSKHSRAVSPSPSRSKHSRATSSPSLSPPRSKHSRVPSPPTPPRSKHRTSPNRSKHSRVPTPSPPRIKHRHESPSRKRRCMSPPTPPRVKHSTHSKHKHRR